MALRGAEIAPFVYLATLGGLLLAFWAGRRFPLSWLERQLREAHLPRAAALLAELRGLPPPRRVDLLRSRLPRRVAGTALRWRYPLLAMLVNLPGSGLIGGGGGISLVAGASGLFRPGATALTLALAVAPLPLVVWATGYAPEIFFSPR